MTQQNLLELAKHGDTEAISSLLNRVLQPRGITAKAAFKGEALHLLLDSAEVPNQQTLVPALHRAIQNLDIESARSVVLYGREMGQARPVWSQSIELTPPIASPSVVENGAVPAAAAAAAMGAVATGGTMNSAMASDLNHPDFLETTQPAVVSVEEIPFEESTPLQSAATVPKAPETDNLGLARNISVLALAGLIAGIIGLHYVLGERDSIVTKQKQAIDQAQILAASATTARNAPDLRTLKTSQAQLQQAASLLEALPDVPSSNNSEVKEELAKIRPQLQDVQDRLRVEEQALTDLKAAESQAQAAVQLIKTDPQSLAAKQQASPKFQDAINLVSAIPEGTYVSNQAKQRLVNYQKNYAIVSQQIVTKQRQIRKQRPISRSKAVKQLK